MSLFDCDIAILCGGKGTRLAPVIGDTPKVLAKIGKKPMMEHLLYSLQETGAREVVICTAHGADKIEAWLDDFTTPFRILLSKEPKPNGEQSAIEAATKLFSRQHLMIFNGDTLLRGRLTDLPRNISPASYCVGGAPSGIRYVERDQASGRYKTDFFHMVDVSYILQFLDIGTPEGYAKAQKEWA